MTPYEIDILLHFYTSPARYECEDAPGFASAVAGLVLADMLEPKDPGIYGTRWCITRRAEFWLKHILATPLPVETFSIPERPVAEATL